MLKSYIGRGGGNTYWLIFKSVSISYNHNVSIILVGLNNWHWHWIYITLTSIYRNTITKPVSFDSSNCWDQVGKIIISSFGPPHSPQALFCVMLLLSLLSLSTQKSDDNWCWRVPLPPPVVKKCVRIFGHFFTRGLDRKLSAREIFFN